MEGAAVFAWKGHDLLPAGSAAADSRGRINPGSHPARAVTFSQPCHCDQGVALEKNQKKYCHNIAAEDEITSDLLFLQG